MQPLVNMSNYRSLKYILKQRLLITLMYVSHEVTTIYKIWFKDRQQSAQRDLHCWSYLKDYVMYINILYVKK